MTEVRSDFRYAVLVTAYTGGFELRIRELLVVVRDRNLAAGWRKLRARVAEVIEIAAEINALDQLPKPASPPALIGTTFLDLSID